MNKNPLTLLSTLFLILVAAFAVNSIVADPKPSVVYVYSDNCRMCVVFDRKVLADSEVKAELSRFSFKKVNANSMNVSSMVTPTVMIYDKNHKLLKKFVPPLDKRRFIDILQEVE